MYIIDPNVRIYVDDLIRRINSLSKKNKILELTIKQISQDRESEYEYIAKIKNKKRKIIFRK